MGFAAGFRAGSELANDRARRELAAAQEERAKLEFQQRQDQWGREQKDREEVANWRTGFGDRLKGPLDTSGADQYLSQFDPKAATGQGLALPQGTAPAAASFMQNNLGVQNYVEQPQPKGLRIGSQQLDGDTLTQLQSMARFAKTPQDVAALEKAYSLARSSKVQGSVTNAILGASNDQISAIAKQYSDFGGTPGKMTVDKDGYTTLTMDGGDPIKMNRYQLAQFVNGMYKLKQGDASGNTDIAAINEQLAKAVGDMNTNMRGAAQVNNTATHNRAQDEKAQAMLANDNARLGLQRDQAKRERKGDFVTLVNPETNETRQADRLSMGVDASGFLKVPAGWQLQGDAKQQKVEPGLFRDGRTGTMYTVTDSGERVNQGGVDSSGFRKQLESSGLSKGEQEQVVLLPGGTHWALKSEVQSNGNNANAYPVAELSTAQKLIREMAVEQARIEEARKRGLQVGAGYTTQGPEAVGLQLGNPWGGRTRQPGPTKPAPITGWGIYGPNR